jgi:hypothetical protein
VAFTELRLKGDINRLIDTNSVSETTAITGVNYLVLSDLNQRIIILGSDNPRIEVKSITGKVMQYLKYNISGDTLFIKSMKLIKDQRANILIHVPKKDFMGVTSKNTQVAIKNLAPETLSIIQRGGQISIESENTLTKLNIRTEESANFLVQHCKIDTINAIINDSEVIIYPQVKLFQGSIENDSYLNLKSPHEIKFKKDESSKLSIN